MIEKIQLTLIFFFVCVGFIGLLYPNNKKVFRILIFLVFFLLTIICLTMIWL